MKIFVNNLKEYEEVDKATLYKNVKEILEDEENEGLIPVVCLNRYMFSDNKILNKYFRYDNHDLEVFHLPELTEEEYDLFVKFNKVKEDSKKLATASNYYKNKALKWIISIDLDIPEKLISFKDYNYNEDYYAFSDYYESVRYAEEDAFRENDNSKDVKTSELYIDMCSRKYSLDYELYKELDETCLKLVKLRLAMCFNVKGIVYLLKDILEFSQGFTENISSDLRDAMLAAKNRLTKMLEDKEMLEWILAGNNDYTLYCSDKITRQIYIEEYRNIISAWTGRDAEEYYKDIIHNAEDKFQDLFYEKTIEDFTCSYIENRDVEEGEDEENREIVLVY